MTILVADGSGERLSSLERLLRGMFPEDVVIAKKDPLAAGKYGFSNPVDILFAAIEMPRLDGLKLIEFVRHANPQALVFLTTGPQGDSGVLWEGEADGLLTHPLTEEALRGALHDARRIRAEKA